MAGVIVGVVAGFAAFMLQKKMTDPAKNHSLVIAIVTLVAAYFVLDMMILAFQTYSMENGIGEWTGTADKMEKTGFENIFNSNIGLLSFLVIIPSWIITGWIILDKKKLENRILIIIGFAMMIAGFSATVYSSFVLFLPTEPPMMRPIEGIDSIFFMHRQEFLLGGIIGMFVTIGEVISFWKKRTGKRNMIKRK